MNIFNRAQTNTYLLLFICHHCVVAACHTLHLLTVSVGELIIAYVELITIAFWRWHVTKYKYIEVFFKYAVIGM